MPNIREAYMLSEVMERRPPRSRVMEASCLKRDRTVDQEVRGSPSIRLSLAKRGGNSLDAPTERGISLCGSSQEETAGMLLVVVSGGCVEVVVLTAGTVVEAMLLVLPGREVVAGVVVVAGGMLVVLVLVVTDPSRAKTLISVDRALSLCAMS